MEKVGIGTAGDVSTVTVTIQDANGNIIPNGDVPVTVTVSGVGTLIGLGSADSNADLHGTEPEKFVDHKYASQGMLKAFVQSMDVSGKVTITASAPGLASGRTTVVTVAGPVPED